MSLVEFDQYISPDRVLYNLDDLGDRAIIGSVTGQGMAPIEYQTQRGPQQHGDTVTGYRLSPRVMQMVHRRNACDRQGNWDNRGELIDVLRPNRVLLGRDGRPLPGTLRKIRPDGSIRDIDVLIEQGPDFESSANEWDEWAFEEALRFVAHDPTFYDPYPVVIEAALPANSELSFPISFPISFGANSATVIVNQAYEGTFASFPVITLTGPMTAVVITNVTTGEAITFVHELVGGQQAVIDLRFGYKTATDPALDPDDPDSNLIGSLSGNIGTWHLETYPQAPGGVNQIQVYIWAVTPGGMVSIQYHNRYIGI